MDNKRGYPTETNDQDCAKLKTDSMEDNLYENLSKSEYLVPVSADSDTEVGHGNRDGFDSMENTADKDINDDANDEEDYESICFIDPADVKSRPSHTEPQREPTSELKRPNALWPGFAVLVIVAFILICVVSSSLVSIVLYETGVIGRQFHQDTGWSVWSGWSICSVTCGDGFRTRIRLCNNPHPSDAGKHCQGNTQEIGACRSRLCSSGGWSVWSNWSPCSVTCSDGFRTRMRLCNSPHPSPAGKHCQGNAQEIGACQTSRCSEGGWSAWDRWSTCSVSCGGGFRTRQRLCNSSLSVTFGSGCLGNSQDVGACHNKRCPGAVSAFSVYRPQYNSQGILSFSEITYNHGHNYNPSTGTFTCSIPGVYHFSVSLTKKIRNYTDIDGLPFHPHDFFQCKLTRNHELIFLIRIKDRWSAPASNSALVDLKTGDNVSLQECSIVTNLEYWSSFTGFLLYEEH